LAVCGQALVELNRESTGWVVSVYGRLDLATAQALDRQYVCGGDAPRVMVDLAGLAWTDSVALGWLLRRQQMGTAHGCAVLVRIAAAQVEHVLEAARAP
jgi:anti-anti-sigma regulatory factor